MGPEENDNQFRNIGSWRNCIRWRYAAKKKTDEANKGTMELARLYKVAVVLWRRMRFSSRLAIMPSASAPLYLESEERGAGGWRA